MVVVLLGAGGTSPAAARDVDTMAERVRACTACHGDEGRASPLGYLPRIAGKPAGYLFNQLRNFREGRRSNAQMQPLLDVLSEPYLREIAAHFAALDPPYPPPPVATASPAVLALGDRLVREGDAARGVPACTSCHGATMTGALPAFPGLLGLPRDYLVAQLGAWRTGLRRATAPDCMAEVVKRLTDDELAAAATWLASQPVPPGARPAPAPPASPLPLRCGSGPS